MKVISTIALLFITMYFAFAQNTLKYSVLITDSVILAKFTGDGSKYLIVNNVGFVDTTSAGISGLQDVISNDNVLTLDNVIQCDTHQFVLENTSLFAIRTPTYADGLLYADDAGGVIIGDVGGSANNTQINISDNPHKSIAVVAQNGMSIEGKLFPRDSGEHNLGREDLHWDTTFTDHTQISDGAGTNKVLTSDANGNATWQANTPPLDSLAIDALTPVVGQTVFCTDCTGNGCTGKLMSWTGSLWRRYACE